MSMRHRVGGRAARLLTLVVAAAGALSAFAQQSGFSTLSFATLKVSKSIAETAVALGEYAAEKDRVAGAVALARRDFWQRYPNGAGLEQAAEAYALALREKDLLLLQETWTTAATRSIGGPSLVPSQADRILGLVFQMTGGPVDGGIHPYAQPLFSAWYGAAYAIGPNAAFNDEINNSLPAYQRYVTARDLGEYLFKSPVSPLESSDPREYLIGVLAATRLSYDYLALEAFVANLEQTAGSAKFAAAVARLRQLDAAEHLIDLDMNETIGGRTWRRFRSLLEIGAPACHDLALYDPLFRTSLDRVDAAARSFEFTDACGSHGIDYVVLGHAAVNALGFRAAIDGYEARRHLVFRDGGGQVFVAGLDNERFVVHEVPAAEIVARIESGDTPDPNPNELAKLSDEELEQWFSRYDRQAIYARRTALAAELMRDDPGMRFYLGGGPTNLQALADVLRQARNVAAEAWFRP